MALAKAGRERQSTRRHKRERELGLRPGERLGEGLRRMAIGQADLAIELLGAGEGEHAGGAPRWPGGPGTAPSRKAVHDTRKALKRLRALLRLLEQELGEQVYERDSAALREVGRQLAGARDAEVMLQTLDDLIARHPRELAGRGGVARLRGSLAEERDRIERLTLGDPAARAFVLGELGAFRTRAAAWRLADGEGISLVEPGLRRLYRQGRERHRRAAAAKGERMRRMHEWRKRVKDLRYAAEMLEPRRAGAAGGVLERPSKRERRRRAEAARQAARVRSLARSADELGELLGEEHDLAVLAGLLGDPQDAGGLAAPRVGRGTRRVLIKLIARRRRKLRRRALRQGARLYRRGPKKFVGRIRKAHEHAARRPR